MELLLNGGLEGWLKKAGFWQEPKGIVIVCIGAVFLFISFFIMKKSFKPKRKNKKESLAPGCDQHVGARKEQQDAFGFSDLENQDFIGHGGAVAVVADGMGGLKGGREASQQSVQAFLFHYMKKKENVKIADQLYASLYEANRQVLAWADETGLRGKAGTTLAAAAVHNHQLYWISAGDSRIYLIRSNQLHQLTSDHTYGRKLEELARSGVVTEQEAESHPEKNSLTSFIGLDSLEEIDWVNEPVAVQSKDMILLCSDGLYHSVTEEEMVRAGRLEAQEAAEELVRIALQKEKLYQDNMTAVILKIS